jgi:hypothetical protein
LSCSFVTHFILLHLHRVAVLTIAWITVHITYILSCAWALSMLAITYFSPCRISPTVFSVVSDDFLSVTHGDGSRIPVVR